MKTHFFQWFSAVAVLTVVVIVIIVAVVLTSGKTPLTLLFLNFIKEFEFFKSFIEDLINGWNSVLFTDFLCYLTPKGFQYRQMKEMVLKICFFKR